MNNNNYIRLSLELHLFFARIMKEHSFFLEVAFTEKDNNFKSIARNFQQKFSDILKKVISYSNGNISNDFLRSGEMITKNTLEAERKTSTLSGVLIDTSITTSEQRLASGNVNDNSNLLTNISNLNKETLPIIENLINFKNDILSQVLECKMYTTNYPLLIEHIMNEAKMYFTLLKKIENRSLFSRKELYEQELFWNKIMEEHAEFIRGLLDPSEKELIRTADTYANQFEMLVKTYGNNLSSLTRASLRETINFRDFKVVGEEGILNCKIRSIIIPLLADHVVREANHFIRILRNINL